MKVAIVDDEKSPAQEIQKLLIKNFPTFEITGIYHKLNDAVKGIKALPPDLLFLDVELDKQQTGFDLLEQINPRQFEVVFVTAYNKFAARAFQYSALHYIQKPIDEALFLIAINKAIETRRIKDFAKRFDTMLGSIRQESIPQKIMVTNLKSDGWICLDVAQILRVDSDGKEVVKITYEENGEYSYTGLSKSVGEVEKMLEGHGFIRIHESHLVNPHHIKMYKRNEQMVVMSDKKEVQISRRNVSLLLEKLKKL